MLICNSLLRNLCLHTARSNAIEITGLLSMQQYTFLAFGSLPECIWCIQARTQKHQPISIFGFVSASFKDSQETKVLGKNSKNSQLTPTMYKNPLLIKLHEALHDCIPGGFIIFRSKDHFEK